MKLNWRELSKMNEGPGRKLFIKNLKSYMHISDNRQISTDIIASLNYYVQNLNCYIDNSACRGEIVILAVQEGYILFNKNDFEVVLKVVYELKRDKGDILNSILHITMTKDAFAVALLHCNVELVLHHKDSTYIDVKPCGEIILDSI